MSGTPQPAPGPTGPAHVQVLHGAPDADELAALVAGLVAAGVQAGQDAQDARERAVAGSAWGDRARHLRTRGLATAPGRDSWRWSLRG